MDIEATLSKVEQELALGHAEEPEGILTELVIHMRRDTVLQWRSDLRDVAERFQPKRRKRLLNLIERRAAGKMAAVRESAVAEGYRAPPVANDDPEFRQELRELGERHIFQWSTHYRDCLNRHFDLYLRRLESNLDEGTVAPMKRSLSEHSRDIFAKGYDHVVDTKHLTHSGAIWKSVAGLGRFLDLPLDYYSALASVTYEGTSILALRSLFSAAVTGILDGYSGARFGDETGAAVLSRFPSQWGHNLAFLTPAAAEEVGQLIEAGPLDEGLDGSVLPLLDTIESLMAKKGEDYFPLPLFGRFSSENGRLEVGVRAPASGWSQRMIEAHAYLDAAKVSTHVLADAHARQVAVLVAPLKPDVREFVNERPTLSDVVVEAGASNRQRVADQATQVWNRTISRLRSKRKGAAISHNIARDFPLHTPNRMPFYHVRRRSVRDLLRAFDRRNGVRLWCSIRRSGKTTACFDMDYTAGGSAIVSQTCGTEPVPNGRFFYNRVVEALGSGAHIKADFVASAVAECAPVAADDTKRKVLVIDEYETLFGLLGSAVERDQFIRYAVVQPLLNQFVEFTRENLLVFLGQQPDAHFILMDQNQLAPYVTQDPFPLFEHVAGTRAGEFSELVGKIFADRIDYDPGFLDALHAETAGHPFLTVNTLCALVDWLIEQKRPHRGLTLRNDDFLGFEDQKLRPAQMALTSDYDLMRGAAKQAMGERAYASNKWLYAVYWIVRAIARENTDDFSVARGRLPEIVENIPAPGPLPDSNQILRTATQANFLRYDDDKVAVKVRTLGRLAASVRPEVA